MSFRILRVLSFSLPPFLTHTRSESSVCLCCLKNYKCWLLAPQITTLWEKAPSCLPAVYQLSSLLHCCLHCDLCFSIPPQQPSSDLCFTLVILLLINLFILQIRGRTQLSVLQALNYVLELTHPHKISPRDTSSVLLSPPQRRRSILAINCSFIIPCARVLLFQPLLCSSALNQGERSSRWTQRGTVR